MLNRSHLLKCTESPRRPPFSIPSAERAVLKISSLCIRPVSSLFSDYLEKLMICHITLPQTNYVNQASKQNEILWQLKVVFFLNEKWLLSDDNSCSINLYHPIAHSLSSWYPAAFSAVSRRGLSPNDPPRMCARGNCWQLSVGTLTSKEWKRARWGVRAWQVYRGPFWYTDHNQYESDRFELWSLGITASPPHLVSACPEFCGLNMNNAYSKDSQTSYMLVTCRTTSPQSR